MKATKTIASKVCMDRCLSQSFRQTVRHLTWVTVISGLALALNAQAAEATYKLFGAHSGGYSSKEDVPAIIKKEIGGKATIAEWEDIKSKFGKSERDLKAFCDEIGLAGEGSACVTVRGQRFWQEQRQYFVYRADHKVPPDFMVHDQLQNKLLLLGSWTDARPVLVKIADYDASDAAKFSQWDKALKEAPQKDVSGMYRLISVSGNKVPTTISHEGTSLRILSGTFTIGADGKCVSKMTFIPPTGVENTIESKATWTREGLKLKMVWTGAGTTSATVDGNKMVMENEGMTLSYQK